MMKRLQLFILASTTIVLVFGFQNCSNGFSFRASDPSFSNLVEGVGPVPDGSDVIPDGGNGPVPGGGQIPGGDPIAMLPPDTNDGDSDTEIDYDYENRRVAISCSTGATLTFNDAELAAAPDLNLANIKSLLSFYPAPLRNVWVANVDGSIAVRNARQISQFSNIDGVVSYSRAIDIARTSNIKAAISVTAASNLRELSNVEADYTCASGANIGRISNIDSIAMKFRGRSDAGGVKSKAQELSNLNATFISIYGIDTRRMANVSGELIVRNSVIDSVDNFNGGLTLIDSQVKSLTNSKGRIRLLNSSIDTKTNVDMDTVLLPKK